MEKKTNRHIRIDLYFKAETQQEQKVVRSLEDAFDWIFENTLRMEDGFYAIECDDNKEE